METSQDQDPKPPRALWIHAALVSTAVVLVVRDATGGGLWALLVAMALILWQLLRGSWFAWWVQVLGVAGSLAGLYGAHRRVASSEVDISIFLDPFRAGLTGILLAAAAAALLHPTARAHVARRARGSGSLSEKVAFVLAVSFVASAPIVVLSAERRLPSKGLLEVARGGIFVGGDRREGTAFYARETPARLCLILVERSGSRLSCDDAASHPSHATLVNGQIAGLVTGNVARVDVRAAGSPSDEGVVVDHPRVSANFYYVRSDLVRSTDFEVTGYDVEGKQVFRWSAPRNG